MSPRLRLQLYRVLLAVAVLAVWQLASGTLVAEFFISKPTAILDALRKLVVSGNLFFHVGIKIGRAHV